jgi:two-component system, sensor histidine kinase
VAAAVRNRHIVDSVRDCGIGITPSTLPHIFDFFMQSDASVPRSRSGLGVELVVVRAIVELHGGRVFAQSAGPGHGSEFTVCLPKE